MLLPASDKSQNSTKKSAARVDFAVERPVLGAESLIRNTCDDKKADQSYIVEFHAPIAPPSH